MANELPSIEERVLNGARLLDEHMPGWELKIDLSELEMRSCYKCILGQVYSEYTHGLSKIGLMKCDDGYYDNGASERASANAVMCGFEYGRKSEEYNELGKVWTQLIKDRLDAGIVLEH